MNSDKLLKFFFIFLLIFSFADCSKKEKLEEINFSDTLKPKESASLAKSEINICVGSMITPQEGYAYYKALLDYLGKKLDMKVNFIDRKTYAEVNSLLKNKDIDVAFVCGGPYVIGHDDFGLELLVAPQVEGKTVYYSYIIVRKNSGLNKFDDLKGKTFAFTDPLSNSGRIVLLHMLEEINETPDSFFKDWLYTYSHDNSIKAVALGIVDGAAVDSLIWQYLDKKGFEYTKDTKIIRISNPYGIPPVVARPGLESDLKSRIKNVLLDMHNDEEGRRILEGMGIDRFVEVDDSLYDSIRAIRENKSKN